MTLACKKLCKKNLHRPHIHSTTCLLRRYYYNINDRQQLVLVKPRQQVFVMNAVNPMVLPKNYTLYQMAINWGTGHGTWTTLKRLIKKVLLKFQLSVSEVVANW